MAITRLVTTETDRCLRRGEADSIAGCLATGERAARLATRIAEWRAESEAECAGVNPFVALGYPNLCSGQTPVSPPFCGRVGLPCTFPSTTVLARPGDDNDLLDCLECQLVEAGLGVARAIHGAEICCTSEGCGSIRTRVACRRAGGAPAYYRLDSIAAGSAISPHGIAVGSDGSLYVADTAGGRIFVRRPDGTIAELGSTGGAPFGIAVDPGGNVYAALRASHMVVRVAADGTRTVFAGTGAPTHSGDGGPATAATITAPNGVAVDPQGNVYVTESGATAFILYGVGVSSGERVRVVDTSGTIHPFAGTGTYGLGTIPGPALLVGLGAPYQLAMAARGGGVLIGEVGLQRVLRVDPDGILHHLAGRSIFIFGGVGSYAGDAGPAVQARLYGAEGLGADAAGNTFIADMRNSRVRMVDAGGSIITVAGTGIGDVPGTPDGMPGTLVSAGCPGALAVGPDGRVYYPDLYTSRIRVLTLVSY
jgi:DNA-binding beta-propeller fold protein YncE